MPPLCPPAAAGSVLGHAAYSPPSSGSVAVERPNVDRRGTGMWADGNRNIFMCRIWPPF